MTRTETTACLPAMEDFIKAVAAQGDEAEGLKLVETQAGLTFDAESGGTAMVPAGLEERVSRSSRDLESARKLLDSTAQTIKTAGEVPAPMRLRHAALAWGCLFLGALVLVTGGFNIYGIAMASGIPAFLEDPKLAVMLAVMPPVGSAALKFFVHYLPHDKARKRYSLSVYALSAASLLAWIALFSLSFGGAGAGIDWGAMTAGGGEAGTGAGFTFVQLLAETFVSGALFIMAGDVFALYGAGREIANPIYAERRQVLEDCETGHETLAGRLAAAKADVQAQAAARVSYINTQILLFRSQCARITAESGLSSGQSGGKKEGGVMRKILAILATGAAIFAVTTAQAKERLFIGVSPALGQEAAQTQARDVLEFLTKAVNPGQEAAVFDAWNLRSLGVFAVPDKPAYAQEKAKLQVNRAVAGALLRLGEEGNPESLPEGAVKLPQFLRFLGSNYGPLEDADIVVLGSPLYVDPQNPKQSMEGGRMPGDDHFAMDAGASPFSVAGNEALLKGARVHIGFSGNNWAIHDGHNEAVRRLWTLFVEGQSGVLSGFTGDRATLWERAARHAGALPHAYRRGAMPAASFLPAKGEARPLFDRPLAGKAAALPETLEDVQIGIRWDCEACDLDLYVRPKKDAPVLSFVKTDSPEGLYHKDFRQSPNAAKGFETVSLKNPVSLKELAVFINWYGGKANKVTGQIRLAANGKVYGMEFNLKAKSGNQGAGREETLNSGKPANAQWLAIDPQAVLGLR
jgi:hypothetical protein